jgi:hypothetical protein
MTTTALVLPTLTEQQAANTEIANNYHLKF